MVNNCRCHGEMGQEQETRSKRCYALAGHHADLESQRTESHSRTFETGALAAAAQNNDLHCPSSGAREPQGHATGHALCALLSAYLSRYTQYRYL